MPALLTQNVDEGRRGMGAEEEAGSLTGWLAVFHVCHGRSHP